jgi:methionyl-tRNA formyltransferase
MIFRELRVMANQRLNIAFAGDRDVSVEVLAALLELGDAPQALLLSDQDRASHDTALVRLCESAGISLPVIRGRQLSSAASVEFLQRLELDYIVCVHFPYMLRRPVLDTASRGVLNLHPSYLPYNRGWHTPTWAILDGTPAGASLHYVDESLDTGDIVCQRHAVIDPADTAHTLYARLKKLEVQVFREGWQQIRDGSARGTPQTDGQATAHRRQSLFDPAVQRLELDAVVRTRDLLRQLRALTTNRLDEAAYFETGARRYRVQVTITPEAMIQGPDHEACLPRRSDVAR